MAAVCPSCGLEAPGRTVKCPDCQSVVSSRDTACKKCGRPLRPEPVAAKPDAEQFRSLDPFERNVALALCAVFGVFGAHRMYLGYHSRGIISLLAGSVVVLSYAMFSWSIIQSGGGFSDVFNLVTIYLFLNLKCLNAVYPSIPDAFVVLCFSLTVAWTAIDLISLLSGRLKRRL